MTITLPHPSSLLQPQHLLDRVVRFRPGVADESARVDDHQIGAVGLGNHPIAVQLQQPGHPLAVDEVLRTAEADQGVGAAGVFLGGGTVDGSIGWASGSSCVAAAGTAACTISHGIPSYTIRHRAVSGTFRPLAESTPRMV